VLFSQMKERAVPVERREFTCPHCGAPAWVLTEETSGGTVRRCEYSCNCRFRAVPTSYPTPHPDTMPYTEQPPYNPYPFPWWQQTWCGYTR